MMALKKTCGEPHTLLLRLFFNIFLFDRFYSICFHLLLSLCCRTSRYGHLSWNRHFALSLRFTVYLWREACKREFCNFVFHSCDVNWIADFLFSSHQASRSAQNSSPVLIDLCSPAAPKESSPPPEMYAGSIIHNNFVCIHFVNSQLEYFNSLFGRNCET